MSLKLPRWFATLEQLDIIIVTFYVIHIKLHPIEGNFGLDKSSTYSTGGSNKNKLMRLIKIINKILPLKSS